MKDFKSLREYIEALNQIGEIQEIEKEVDWNLEIGAIIRKSYDLKAPAPLFNKIKGIEAGFRVFGAPAGVSRQPGLYFSRIALSLGLDPHVQAKEIVEKLAQARDKAPVPPRIVSTGPCKANILLGDEIDLFRFPAPLIHGGDGGRYINTWGTTIVQTPDKKWTNWSMARIMLINKTKMTGLIGSLQHLGIIHSQWKALNRPTPFALALGCEPAIPFVAGMPLPASINEADFIGGYLGRPIDVVRCETVDLYVPATSEIVIEGTIAPTETAPEGPMGEFAGYLWKAKHSPYIKTTGSHPQPVYSVSAITYQNHPILPVVAAGMPIEEDETCWGIGIAANVLADLKSNHFPVSMVFSPFSSAVHWLVITVNLSYREKYKNKDLIEGIRKFVFSTKAGSTIAKIILIGDDIDPSNIDEVVWAFATRSHPERGQHLFPNEFQNPLGAFLSAEEQKEGKSTKVIYSCLPPDSWAKNEIPVHVRFNECWPKEICEKVVKNWSVYGYK